MENIYDLVIVGEGPAGLTAAIYAKRAELDVLLLERYGAGGQILNTYEVDNYPGLPGISGIDLGMKMSEHVDKFGVKRISSEVEAVEDLQKIKVIHTDNGDIKSRAVIIATGNSPRKLGVSGEEELTGSGVSYCATCDGAFFKKKKVVVVGGGDVAVEDAIFLARICNEVILVHRRDELRAAKILQRELFSLDNISVIWDSVVTEIVGEDNVEKILIKNTKTGEESSVDANGIFIATGNTPNLPLIDGINKDGNGYIVADETCKTNLPGIFVAGDVRTKKLRQVSTAVADGANAVYSVSEYLIENKY